FQYTVHGPQSLQYPREANDELWSVLFRTSIEDLLEHGPQDQVVRTWMWSWEYHDQVDCAPVPPNLKKVLAVDILPNMIEFAKKKQFTSESGLQRGRYFTMERDSSE
ncbi:hypothetical protein JTE90_024125, partial [Oedothorax gibbosus]